jgi:hypothetical protein
MIWELRNKGSRTPVQAAHFEAPDDEAADRFAREWCLTNHRTFIGLKPWLLTLDAPVEDQDA